MNLIHTCTHFALMHSPVFLYVCRQLEESEHRHKMEISELKMQ